MKSFRTCRRHRRLLKAGRRMRRHFAWPTPRMTWLGRKLSFLRILNPNKYIRRIDRYIIGKLIGTHTYSIALIITTATAFDFNENLSKFTEYHAPARAIIFDYYANFISYYFNLFSPLFVFIVVIFFTSKLADNSEITAMLASSTLFKWLMRPYMLLCVLIASLSYYLSASVTPHGIVIWHNLESLHRNSRKQTAADNVQLQVGKEVIAYIRHCDNRTKRGYGFSLDKFENKKLVNHMTAMEIQYDTIADSKYHWNVIGRKIRQLKGSREHITSGADLDTLTQMEPTDLVHSKGQQKTFTSAELRDYTSKQVDRGSSNVVQYQVEYRKRIASSFASFILTIIGSSLSARKRKGGTGLYLGLGPALSSLCILLQTVSVTFAINANVPPILAARIPNIIFALVVHFCYRNASN